MSDPPSDQASMNGAPAAHGIGSWQPETVHNHYTGPVNNYTGPVNNYTAPVTINNFIGAPAEAAEAAAVENRVDGNSASGYDDFVQLKYADVVGEIHDFPCNTDLSFLDTAKGIVAHREFTIAFNACKAHRRGSNSTGGSDMWMEKSDILESGLVLWRQELELIRAEHHMQQCVDAVAQTKERIDTQSHKRKRDSF